MRDLQRNRLSNCSGTGWLEILGSGMLDPELYRFVNYDPEIYSGFAFGLGIERVAMLKSRDSRYSSLLRE